MGNSPATLMMSLAGLGLTWLVQSTVLLSTGLLAGRLLKRVGAAIQSGVYRTTLAAVLVCPFASAILSATGYDGLTFRLPRRMTGEVTTAEHKSVAPLPSISETVPNDRNTLTSLVNHVDPPSKVPADKPDEPVVAVEPATWQPAMDSLAAVEAVPAIGLLVWLLGAAMMGARLLAAQRRMTQLRATAVPAEPAAEALCRELAARMGVGTPAVLRSPFLFSPCLDGLRKPVILLPEDIDENLHDTFIHELAHLARRDGWWNLVRRSSVAALWVQPLLWILSRRLEGVAEEVCDDFVVQFGADRTRYAGHLLKLAERTLPPMAPAGVGMVSFRSMLARRVVRLLDTSRSLSTRVGTRAVVAMVVIGLAGTLLAGLLGVGSGTSEAMARVAETKPALRGQTIRATDNVTTGKRVEPPAVKDEQADVPINGRIVDLEGRPIAGVTVRLRRITAPKQNSLTPWIEAAKRGEPSSIAWNHLNYAPPLSPEAMCPKATTDAQGRVQFTGLGAERVVTLDVFGPTIAYREIDVVTRRVEPISARGFDSRFGPGFETVYGSDFTFAAAPGRRVEGTVRDAKTGFPLPGVEITSDSFAGTNNVGVRDLKSKTDSGGRFRLIGFGKGRGNRIVAVPSDDQPYFMREVSIPDPPGFGPVPLEIKLHRGIWIEGKVTDKASGQPVPGVRLHYLPFLKNKFTHDIPEFNQNGFVDAALGFQDHYQASQGGTYRLVGLPGPAIIGAEAVSPLYREGAGSETIKGMNERGHFETYSNPIEPGKSWPTAMKEIDPPAQAEVVHLDLALERGAAVRLRAVDSLGQPVIGVKVAGRAIREEIDTNAQSGAEFDVVNLAPDEDRIVMLRHESRKHGKVVHVREGDGKEGPVIVVLEPWATIAGRVTDAQGDPVSGATIESRVFPLVDFFLRLDKVTTDQQGRFLVPNVPTGCDYQLEVEELNMPKRRTFLERTSVRPGETTDVGGMLLKND